MQVLIDWGGKRIGVTRRVENQMSLEEDLLGAA